MAFCQKCGSPLSDGAKFCPGCGATVGGSDDGTKRKQVFVGEVRKCPNCGTAIQGFEGICPECGMELNKKTSSEILEFRNEITQIDKEIQQEAVGKAPTKKWWTDWSTGAKVGYVILNVFTYGIVVILHFVIKGMKAAMRVGSGSMTPAEKRKQQTIQSFVIPNNKEGIMEFLTFAKGQRDIDAVNADDAKWRAVWNNKCLQVIAKAQPLYAGEKKFQEQLAQEKVACDQFSKSAKIRMILPLGILAAAVLLLVGTCSISNSGVGTKVEGEKTVSASDFSLQKDLARFVDISSDVKFTVDKNDGYSVTVSMEVTGKSDSSYADDFENVVQEKIKEKGWKSSDVEISSGFYDGSTKLGFKGYSGKYSPENTDTAEKILSDIKSGESKNIKFRLVSDAMGTKGKKDFANRVMSDSDYVLSLVIENDVENTSLSENNSITVTVGE